MAFFPFNFIVIDLIMPFFPLTQNLSKQPQICCNNISSEISHIHPNIAPKKPIIDSFTQLKKPLKASQFHPMPPSIQPQHMPKPKSKG